MSKPADLVQGTLDLLVLKIIALEPQHGWAIGQRLRQMSGDTLQVSDGSLYPALHKLELAGWIKAEWKPGELMPSEPVLAARYQVGISTIRAALAELAAAGVVVRRQGKGTFVGVHGESRSVYRFFRSAPFFPHG